MGSAEQKRAVVRCEDPMPDDTRTSLLRVMYGSSSVCQERHDYAGGVDLEGD